MEHADLESVSHLNADVHKVVPLRKKAHDQHELDHVVCVVLLRRHCAQEQHENRDCDYKVVESVVERRIDPLGHVEHLNVPGEMACHEALQQHKVEERADFLAVPDWLRPDSSNQDQQEHREQVPNDLDDQLFDDERHSRDVPGLFLFAGMVEHYSEAHQPDDRALNHNVGFRIWQQADMEVIAEDSHRKKDRDDADRAIADCVEHAKVAATDVVFFKR